MSYEFVPGRCSECDKELEAFRDHAISIGDRRQRFCRECWMSGIAMRLFQSLMRPPLTEAEIEGEA